MTNKLLMAAFMALGLCQTAKAQTMKEALGKYFIVGAAVNTNVVYGIDNKGANVVK
jgi:endo-1,4-beta-xylanase